MKCKFPKEPNPNKLQYHYAYKSRRGWSVVSPSMGEGTINTGLKSALTDFWFYSFYRFSTSLCDLCHNLTLSFRVHCPALWTGSLPSVHLKVNCPCLGCLLLPLRPTVRLSHPVPEVEPFVSRPSYCYGSSVLKCFTLLLLCLSVSVSDSTCRTPQVEFLP